MCWGYYYVERGDIALDKTTKRESKRRALPTNVESELRGRIGYRATLCAFGILGNEDEGMLGSCRGSWLWRPMHATRVRRRRNASRVSVDLSSLGVGYVRSTERGTTTRSWAKLVL